MLKPQLIAGCCVLSVLCATPGAHARSWEAYHCGKYKIAGVAAGLTALNETFTDEGTATTVLPPRDINSYR